MLTAWTAAALATADPDWERYYAEACATTVDAVLAVPMRPPEAGLPLGRCVVVAPAHPSAGLALAIADLRRYLQAVTGTPVGDHPDGQATVIAIGQHAPPTDYAVVAGPGRVDLDGRDPLASQYAIYRFMALTGWRPFHYADTYVPPVGQAVLPAAGFAERRDFAFRIRGFAPHTYHPVPLAMALHEPSEAHFQTVKAYLDWLVATGQNRFKFELLELDAPNRFLPGVANHRRFQAWLPYARRVLTYAHLRGLKVSLNVAFANDVSNNPSAIDPWHALGETFQLNGLETGPRARYQAALALAEQADFQALDAMLDRLMQAPWDDISWCLGTSEFSSTNDDLTLAWMNEAARHLRTRYPGTTTTVISHIPSRPVSLRYEIPYFNLADLADDAVGEWIHTTELYALTDPAPVYGNQDFAHKLVQLYDANPRREVVFEPETSYWVSYDASVPLFLPVYITSRARDIAAVYRRPDLAGHVTFTTAWEWGYWLTDYVVGRLQASPTAPLLGVLDDACAPFGPARVPARTLLADAMRVQQTYLIDRGLIRDLQGAGALTNLGAAIRKVPGLNQLLEGTTSSPVRLSPADLIAASPPALAALESGELRQLGELEAAFGTLSQRANALRGVVPTAARHYWDELADGFEIDALRATEVRASLVAAACARHEQLSPGAGWRERGLAELATARTAWRQAAEVVARREPHYRDSPADTYGPARGPTMWNDRYLTPVHTLEYWRNTYDEAARLYL